MAQSKRVAVTSPQTRVAHARRLVRHRWRAPVLGPAEAERATALFHAQRKIAVTTLVLLGTLLIGVPLVLALTPVLGHVRVLGIPVSWVALVAVPYPAMVLLAWWQLRGAERAEDR